MTVTAVTVATVAVPVTNDVGVKKSAAVANATERRIDGRYDMAVSLAVFQWVIRDGNFEKDLASGIDGRAPGPVRLRLATTS